MEIRNDRGVKLKHSWTDMTSFWLSFWQKYPSSERGRLKNSFLYLHCICVTLVSLLWTQWRARTNFSFKHWRRTWWYVCQPSDLGQGTSWDFTKHRFPTDIFMLTFYFHS
jgi:hypothetical protein